MKSISFTFEIPSAIDVMEYNEDLLTYYEQHAMCAFYLAGNDEMDLENTLEACGITPDEYDAKSKYYKAVDNMFDIVWAYNAYIKEAGLDLPEIIIRIDKEKIKYLCDYQTYPIYEICIQ